MLAKASGGDLIGVAPYGEHEGLSAACAHSGPEGALETLVVPLPAPRKAWGYASVRTGKVTMGRKGSRLIFLRLLSIAKADGVTPCTT